MPITVRLPGALRDTVGGESKLTASGRTLDEVFADVERRHPGFRSRVVDDDGRLRTYVNVYIGDTDARASGGLAAEVPADAEVMVIPAMAGGGATVVAERVAIPGAIGETIVQHAREQGTLECCGLIAARGGVPTRAIRCANAATTSSIRYRIDPREQLAALRSMDAAGEELFGIYHSHPASVAFPSPTDRMEAYYPEAVYVLVSLRSGAPELRAFRIAPDAPGSEKAVRELTITP